MKISLQKVAIGMVVAVLLLSTQASVARAEDSTSTISAEANVQVTASTTVTSSTTAPGRAPLRERVNARVEQIKENSAQNRDQRNKIIDERKDVNKARVAEVKDIKADARVEMKNEKGDRGARRETFNKMRQDVFIARRNALARQLSISIENLENIKTRIDTRIAKAKASGRDMTEAENLLVIAVAKIATAKVNVAALANIVPPVSATSTASSTNATTTVTATSTVEVDLTKPRVAAEVAIKSIRDARDALKKVIVAIAKGMGLGGGKGNTTGTTTSATTTIVATTTVSATTTATTSTSTNQ